MPLETIGNYALAVSNGAIARGSRQTDPSQYTVANDSGFAASSARGGDTGGEEVRLPSASPNVAVYLSPFIRLDLETRLAIVEFRDSQTGAVKEQYPSPRAVKEYQQNLPETSDLQPHTHQDNAGTAANLQVRLIGPGQSSSDTGSPDTTTGPVFGAGHGSSGTAAPAPGSSPAPAPTSSQVQAAAAAFGATQGTQLSTRQLAVA